MAILWSMRDLVEAAKKRIENNFDLNIAFSGQRGNGKSTGLYKFFSHFDNFRPKRDLVYTRRDVMHLLESRKYGCVFDDEAIRTAYKRNFQEQDQKLLIQMLNMYRDNFNIYGMAIPNFYSLDKDLRNLIKIHVHVVKRGLACIHIINDENLYSEDPWDIKHNQKIEEKWAKIKMHNPKFKPPYYKLSTFKGYLKYGDLSAAQKNIYLKIKEEKRKHVYETEIKSDEEKKEDTIYNNIIKMLKEGKMTREIFANICLAYNINQSVAVTSINKKLKEAGELHRLKTLLVESEKINEIKHTEYRESRFKKLLRKEIPVI